MTTAASAISSTGDMWCVIGRERVDVWSVLMTLTIVTRGTRRKYGYVRRNCLVCGPLSSCRNVVTSAAKQLKAYPTAHDQRSSLHFTNYCPESSVVFKQRIFWWRKWKNLRFFTISWISLLSGYMLINVDVFSVFNFSAWSWLQFVLAQLRVAWIYDGPLTAYIVRFSAVFPFTPHFRQVVER